MNLKQVLQSNYPIIYSLTNLISTEGNYHLSGSFDEKDSFVTFSINRNDSNVTVEFLVSKESKVSEITLSINFNDKTVTKSHKHYNSYKDVTEFDYHNFELIKSEFSIDLLCEVIMHYVNALEQSCEDTFRDNQ